MTHIMGSFYSLVYTLAFIASFFGQTQDLILLTKDNHAAISGKINDKLANTFLVSASQLDNDAFIFINSPGGSVLAGNKIVRHVRHKNYTCIADHAASMAFVIMQACARRYVTSTSVLMQHQQSLEVGGDLQAINAYLSMVNAIERDLSQLQASRIGMKEEEFRQRTMSEWWLYGNDIITNRVADKLVHVECSRDLYNKTITSQKQTWFGETYDVTHSACPLITV